MSYLRNPGAAYSDCQPCNNAFLIEAPFLKEKDSWGFLHVFSFLILFMLDNFTCFFVSADFFSKLSL